jgi:xanthosine utilization system XapX-like protein
MSDVVNMPEPRSASWAVAQLWRPFEELVESAFADDEIQEALRDPVLSAEDLYAEIVRQRDELLLAPSAELRELSAATNELRALTTPPAQTRLIVTFPFGGNLVLYVDRVGGWLARAITRLGRLVAAPLGGEASISPDSGDVRVSAAQAEVEVARRAYTDVVFEKGVQRLLRSLIEERTEVSYSTTLAIQAAPGLAELTRKEPGLSTSLATCLQRAMRGMGGGSIGISGPRGIGKTTLLEAFVLGDHPIRTDTRHRPLSLLVSAPVAYDGRDFVLHLFAELCQRLLASAGLGSFDYERTAPDDHATLWLRRLVVVQVLALGVAFAGGAALLVDALTPNDSRRQAFLVGAVVLAVATGILLGLLRSLAFRRLRRRSPPLAERVLGFIGLLGLLVGSALILLAALNDHLSTTTQRATLVTLIGLSAVVLELLARRVIVWGMQNYEDPLEFAGGSDDWMVPIAYAWRDRIRFQQRYTTGWSGGLIAPFGLEATRSGSKDATEQQLTFPGAVAALRRFIEQAAGSRDVVIAIDELDKMESSDTANRFLNEIKAIFRIEHCFYLVSVSEDAMSQFERRGMPLRDVFDSSFDEVLYLERLKIGESRRLLGERVIGLPTPFLFMAHCMSAGLPRDLIRITRELIDIGVRRGEPVALSEVCRQAVRSELSRKARATTVIVRGIDTEPHAGNFLQWVERISRPTLGARELLDCCATVQDVIAAELPLLPDGSEQARRRQLERSKLVELTLELTLVAYFAATLLDFFRDTLTRDELRRVEQDAEGESAIELLAGARQSFGINRRIAWSLISRFRDSVSLADGPAFPSVVSSSEGGKRRDGRTPGSDLGPLARAPMASESGESASLADG